MANWVNLGRKGYQECYALQQQMLHEVLNDNREDTLLFVEHSPVLTLGSNFHQENLLLPQEQYSKLGIEVIPTDRGGDVTYHGPGQLVIYPIFNIAHYGKDLHHWLRNLEETIVLTLKEFGLGGYRFPPHTGVWVENKKIAAIGIKVRKWINMHGIALNCNNDLNPFQWVIPCGIKEFGVTSISHELKKNMEIQEAITPVLKGFEQVFGIELNELNANKLLA